MASVFFSDKSSLKSIELLSGGGDGGFLGSNLKM
jgi:hypothetical protein